MDITFSVPHVFYQGSSQDENADALRILLDALIRVNLAYLHHHSVPALYQAGVVYGRTEIWDSIPALYARKFGDCKSLTAALVAQYLIKGIEAKPEFRFLPMPDGSTEYHILVRVNGVNEDPSKRLGMLEYEAAHAARQKR